MNGLECTTAGLRASHRSFPTNRRPQSRSYGCYDADVNLVVYNYLSQDRGIVIKVLDATAIRE